jgi:cellulose synthase (UDP-forming)
MSRQLTPRIARYLAVATAVYILYYLWWRATWTLNWDALGFALLLLVAEIQDSVAFLFFVLQVWKPKQEVAPAPPEGLRVDVYVPTYNEDLDVLEATLTGCNALRYPHTTYVLDDGRRLEVAALAERLGCGYFTRADNQHAKAGNINAALARTHGDLIAVFDADMVPQPDFLDRTLGYFVDERVAVVQLPQEFYNVDSVQHAGRQMAESWHEQSLFFRVIQPGRHHWNAAFWCGSPSVVRRAALDDVGGVATETVTEDIHTTIRMHSRGWRTVYHNEALAFGIAPQTLHAFAVQRLRWAQGTLQLLRTRDNPLLVPGLNLAQRLNYLASTLHFAEGYQDLVYVLTPVVVLLTGVWPLRVGGLEFLALWLPFVSLKLLCSVVLGRGYYRWLQIEQYSLLRMFTLIRASIVLLVPRGLRFRVTPKGVDEAVYSRERRQILPHVGVLALILAALVLGVRNQLEHMSTWDTSSELTLVAIIWAVCHAGLLVSGVWRVLRRLHERQDYRFTASLRAVVRGPDGVALLTVTEDLSLYGCGLLAAVELPDNHQISVTLQLPNEPLTVQATVAHRSAVADGQWRLGVRFVELGALERQRLVEYLFITLPRDQSLPLNPVEPAQQSGAVAA